jgi:hypothetical protein
MLFLFDQSFPRFRVNPDNPFADGGAVGEELSKSVQSEEAIMRLGKLCRLSKEL